jgi:hypothetical protein
MSLDWTTLRGLAEMTDHIGVLSLYATADPHDETSQPAWRLRARTELKKLREQAKKAGSREYYTAVSSRLDSLDQDVEMMLDSRTQGLGRALFAAISNGQVERITLQVPLDDQVKLAPTAQLRPLVTAWSAAAPAGCIAVAADEVRVIDLRLGLVHEIETIPHPEDLADRRELTGKGHATVSTTHHSSASHHDLFDRREEDRLLRYLHSLGPSVAKHAREQGWECIVVTGETKYVAAVTENLPANLSAELAKLPHTITALTPPKLASVVEPALAEARAARNLQLAQRTRDAGLSANSDGGACGLRPTLAALQEGRVAHLLMAHDGTWTGSRNRDGVFFDEFEVPRDASAADLTPEPRLDERMIEMAFREGAAVTILDDTAATPLSDTDGIGAILRW